LHPADGTHLVLDRLAHHLKNPRAEFRKLIQEKHAAVCERDLARMRSVAVAYQSCVADQVVCAHGTLTQVTSGEVTATRFEFSDEPNTFFAYSVDETYVRPETARPWQPGDCVMLYGTVGVYSRIPYLDLKERPPAPCAPGLR
jgi:hypothetical protein